MSEDQSQILSGSTQNHINGISLTAFEMVTVQQAITFHVSDYWFNGIAPFQLFSDTARNTTLLSCLENFDAIGSAKAACTAAG